MTSLLVRQFLASLSFLQPYPTDHTPYSGALSELDHIRFYGYKNNMKELARIFQSLDDETRLRIMALLLHEQELCVCDIMAVLQLPQSTVSRHLSLLKNLGWLQDRREGLWVLYSLVKQPEPLQQTLLPILRHFLHGNPTAQADQERLRGFNTKSCCA